MALEVAHVGTRTPEGDDAAMSDAGGSSAAPFRQSMATPAVSAHNPTDLTSFAA